MTTAGVPSTVARGANGTFLGMVGGVEAWTAIPAGVSPSDATPASVGTAAAGVSALYSRGDHVHPHGDQLGGSLHALAGASAGFMSPTQVTQLAGALTDITALTAADVLLDGRLDVLEGQTHEVPLTFSAPLDRAGNVVSIPDGSIALAKLANGTTGQVPYYVAGVLTDGGASGADRLTFNPANGRLSPGGDTDGYLVTNSITGTTIAYATNSLTFNSVSAAFTGARVYVTASANIASAASIAIAANSALVTGTTTINTIATTGWGAGGIITLQFAGALTISNSAGNIRSATGANITTAAGMTISFWFDGTNWHEIGRSLGGGGTIDGSGTATHLTSWTDSDTVQASGITLVSNLLTHAAAASGASVGLLVSNSSNTATSSAIIEARVAGTSAASPEVLLTITGGTQSWKVRAANAADDRFEIVQGASTVHHYIDPSANIGTGHIVWDPSGTGARRLSLSSYTGETGIDPGLVLSLPVIGTNEGLTILPRIAGTAGSGVSAAVRDTSAGQWKRLWKGTNRAGPPILALLEQGGNLSAFATGSFGGGQGVWFIANAATPPSSPPTGGNVHYVEAGVSKIIDTGGNITALN